MIVGEATLVTRKIRLIAMSFAVVVILGAVGTAVLSGFFIDKQSLGTRTKRIYV